MTEHQAHMLQLLKEFDELCRRHSIQYYLIGGSLIGAVRHHGFLPWDDDSDVIMSRDNWDKFLSYAVDDLPEHRRISSQYLDLNTALTINRYMETNTTSIFRYHITNPEISGNQIDVFIMDPVPEDEVIKRAYEMSVLRHTELTCLYYQYSLRAGESTEFTKYWNECKDKSKKEVLEEIDGSSFQYQEDECDLYAQRYAGAIHFWPKEAFGQPRYVTFEDTKLPIPERYHEILTIGFDDDWMMLPKGAANQYIHEHVVRSQTLPSKVIYDDFESHINRDDMMSLFTKRKKLWETIAPKRLLKERESCIFQSMRIKLLYEKRTKETDIYKHLAEKEYKELEEFFAEYIRVQCMDDYSGSSSLSESIQWYRKKNPIYIDIGDETIYVLLRLFEDTRKIGLLHRFLKIRKQSDRPLSKDIREMDSLYSLLHRMQTAYYSHDYIACQDIIKEGLSEYPEDPTLNITKCLIDLKDCDSSQAIISAVNNMLAKYPEDEELIMRRAEGYLLDKNYSSAFEDIDDLIKNSRNGIILQKIYDIIEELLTKEEAIPNLDQYHSDVCKKLGIIVENSEPSDEQITEDNYNNDSQIIAEESLCKTSPVLAVRLQLLKDLDDICRNNNISYFLRGGALLQAVRFRRFLDSNAPITLFMTPDNINRFVSLIRKEGRKDRYIQSMETHGDFFRLSVRYGASNTLEFPISVSTTEDPFGIYITIEVLRQKCKSSFDEQLNHMLEYGWEVQDIDDIHGRKAHMGKNIVKLMKKTLGKDRTGRYIYRRLLRSRGDNKDYYSKFFQKHRKYYPNEMFSSTSDVELEGFRFMTVKNPDDLLSMDFKGDWRTRVISDTSINPINRIVDTEISGQEYLDYLNTHHVSIKDIYRNWKVFQDNDQAVQAISKKTIRYWYLMNASGKRFELFEKYYPRKNELMNIYRQGRIDELVKELKEYYDAALEYIEYDIGLSFDPEIDKMLIDCISFDEKTEEAEQYTSLLDHQNWTPVKDLIDPESIS